ncbi:MAG: murein biosynthesis integral membrane protein MurJ [Chloroflexi bacterium]|nr:murein biosynthesis integral membrane protein MurJ [Chloroflexota bacterium]
MSTTATPVSSTRQVARAATVVMALFLFSRVAGLAREMIIGARFGTGADLDAYLAAFRVPDLLFQLIAGGALGSAFIPVFTGSLARRDLRGAWRLFSAVSNLVLIVMTTVAVVAALIAPWLVRTVLAPGFSPDQQALTVSLMRWMLVSTIIFGVSGIVMGVLNSFQHFLLPALAPVLYNLSIIAGAWFLAPQFGVFGLVIGVVVGAGLHLDVQMFGLWRYSARYYPTLGLDDSKVREVGRLMAPRVLGLAAVQLNFWINTLLASALPAGSLSALNYAWLLMLLPQGIVAQAVATAAFPTFASLEAQGKITELRRVLSTTLRAILFLTIPAAAGLFAWRVPLVRLLLERGEFTARSTELTAYALAFYAFGLIGHSVIEIVARAFYALHDTRTPVAISLGGMALNAGLSLLLRGPLGHAGLALANTAATLLETALLVWLLSRRLGGLSWVELGTTTLRAGLAAAVMAVPLGWLAPRLGHGPAIPIGVAGLILGALLYGGAAFLLRMPELRMVRQMTGR